MDSKRTNLFCRLLLIGILALLLFSCSLSPSRLLDEKATLQNSDTPLAKSYEKIIIFKFEADSALEKNFPEATGICESATMNELLNKSSVSRIEKSRSSSYRAADAILVMAYLTTPRPLNKASGKKSSIPSNRSEMAASLKLIDAETGTVVREKKLMSAANKPALQTSSPDRDLPATLGRLIASYLAQIVQGE